MYRATDGDLRLADAERRVSALPREFGLLRKRLVNPIGRTSLDFANRFRDRNRRRQFGEKVDVVLDSVDEVQLPAELANDAAEVREEPRFKRGVDERLAIFRRVDDVREEVAVAVRHGAFAMRMSRRGCVPRKTFSRPLRRAPRDFNRHWLTHQLKMVGYGSYASFAGGSAAKPPEDP